MYPGKDSRLLSGVSPAISSSFIISHLCSGQVFDERSPEWTDRNASSAQVRVGFDHSQVDDCLFCSGQTSLCILNTVQLCVRSALCISGFPPHTLRSPKTIDMLVRLFTDWRFAFGCQSVCCVGFCQDRIPASCRRLQFSFLTNKYFNATKVFKFSICMCFLKCFS